MAGKNTDLVSLKELLREAHTLIDDHGLYDIWENIPKSGDPDFKGDSFNEYIRQVSHADAYNEWSSRLEETFFENNLDFLRFKVKVQSGDGRYTSDYPVPVFLKKVRELDNIISNPAALSLYKTDEQQLASWPHITYQDGRIRQGNRSHQFTDPTYIKLFDILWENRRVESPSGDILVAEKSLDRGSVNKDAGIRDHERFTDIATGVRKAMSSKHINLRLMYPDKVFVVVRQTRR